MKCCICGKDLKDPYGHSPDPVKKKGRCCENCNNTVVIPARRNPKQL